MRKVTLLKGAQGNCHYASRLALNANISSELPSTKEKRFPHNRPVKKRTLTTGYLNVLSKLHELNQSIRFSQTYTKITCKTVHLGRLDVRIIILDEQENSILDQRRLQHSVHTTAKALSLLMWYDYCHQVDKMKHLLKQRCHCRTHQQRLGLERALNWSPHRR